MVCPDQTTGDTPPVWSQKHKCLQRQFLPVQGPPQLVCSGTRSSGSWDGGGEGFLFYIFTGSADSRRWASVHTFLTETLRLAQLQGTGLPASPRAASSEKWAGHCRWLSDDVSPTSAEPSSLRQRAAPFFCKRPFLSVGYNSALLLHVF